jgi:hypothetical protein
MVSDEQAAQHHVLVAGDNEWQRDARLLQALWRERHNLPVGMHRGHPLGSRLAMPFAKDALAGFTSETVRNVVRAEVLDLLKSTGKLYEEPRIYDNLLTSQALCFNLFAELQKDLGLASRAVGRLLAEPTLEVTAIEFEYSPGRSDPRFTADQSAFDVFVVYEVRGGRCFLGVEVKYAETMGGKVARHRDRYDEVAEAMGCFRQDALPALRQQPLEQFWRNHLLAGSLLLIGPSGFRQGQFVVLYPKRNTVVHDAVVAYRACLNDDRTSTSWTLEAVLEAIQGAGGEAWALGIRDRYLG